MDDGSKWTPTMEEESAFADLLMVEGEAAVRDKMAKIMMRKVREGAWMIAEPETKTFVESEIGRLEKLRKDKLERDRINEYVKSIGEKHEGTSIGYVAPEGQEVVAAENAMAELGTEGMTPEQILGAPTVIYPGPRPKKGQPGYRAGMTKKHNRGLPKNKRKMAEKSRKMNRGK